MRGKEFLKLLKITGDIKPIVEKWTDQSKKIPKMQYKAHKNKLFLCVSKTEPCGLGQVATRYRPWSWRLYHQGQCGVRRTWSRSTAAAVAAPMSSARPGPARPGPARPGQGGGWRSRPRPTLRRAAARRLRGDVCSAAVWVTRVGGGGRRWAACAPGRVPQTHSPTGLTGSSTACTTLPAQSAREDYPILHEKIHVLLLRQYCMEIWAILLLQLDIWLLQYCVLEIWAVLLLQLDVWLLQYCVLEIWAVLLLQLDVWLLRQKRLVATTKRLVATTKRIR